MKRSILFGSLLLFMVSAAFCAMTASPSGPPPHNLINVFPDAAKQAMIDAFVKDVRANPSKFPDFAKIILSSSALEVYESNNKHRPPTEDEALRKLATVYLFGTSCTDLGGGVTWREGPWWGDGCFRCRDCHYEAVACFSHPDLEKVWGDVVDCANIAAAAAGIGCIIAGPEACLPTFKAAFIACLEAKGLGWAKDIIVELRVDKRCGGDFCCTGH